MCIRHLRCCSGQGLHRPGPSNHASVYTVPEELTATMMTRLRALALLCLLLAAIPCLWFTYPAWIWYVAPGDPAAAAAKANGAVPIVILYDENDSLIQIGVPANVTEQQLRATLVKVANDRQDDAARDYLMSAYLRVQAYLLRDGHQSSAPAGQLVRYVPFTNPARRRSLRRDRSKMDKIEVDLRAASPSL